MHAIGMYPIAIEIREIRPHICSKAHIRGWIYAFLLQACRVDGNSGGIAVDDIINGSVSDVFSYSALTLAVRCSHLDVVEAIISTPRCDVDRPGRTGLSALDEALDAWFRAAVASVPGNTSPTQSPSSFSQTAITSCESGNAGLLVVSTDVSSSICSWNRHNCAQRYRIVRRLLEVGASRMSLVALDRLVAAALDTASGQAFVEKLVKVPCWLKSKHVLHLLANLKDYCAGIASHSWFRNVGVQKCDFVAFLFNIQIVTNCSIDDKCGI